MLAAASKSSMTAATSKSFNAEPAAQTVSQGRRKSTASRRSKLKLRLKIPKVASTPKRGSLAEVLTLVGAMPPATTMPSAASASCPSSGKGIDLVKLRQIMLKVPVWKYCSAFFGKAGSRRRPGTKRVWKTAVGDQRRGDYSVETRCHCMKVCSVVVLLLKRELNSLL